MGLISQKFLTTVIFLSKERLLPDLCADRIAYGLQDALNFEEINRSQAKGFLEALRAEDGRWFLLLSREHESLRSCFLEMSDVYWASEHSAVELKTVGDVLRHSLEQGHITHDDLHTTDREVLDKITAAKNDGRLLELLKRMNAEYSFVSDRTQYDLHTFCKSRAVDPYCMHEGRIVRVSDVDPEWGPIVSNGLEPKEHFIKFTPRV